MERDYQLLEDNLTKEEKAVRVAKYLLLKAMNYGFTEYMIVKIARNDMPERQFKGAIKKALGGLYGGVEGYSEAELEITAVQLGVDELIFPLESASAEGNAESAI